jgi:hypothetical protein
VLVVEELGIVVDVVEVVEVVEVVDVVEVVEVVVVPRSVAGGASADIESTASGDGAIVEELVVELGGTVVVELGGTVVVELVVELGTVVVELGTVVVELGTVVVELDGTVESVGASSTIGISTHVCAGSNPSDALTGATGNDATIAANTATKHPMRLCERARKNSLVPLTPRIHRN